MLVCFVGCLWFDSVSLVLYWIAWVGCFAIGCVGMLCCVVNSVVVYVYLHFTLRLACLVWYLCSWCYDVFVVACVALVLRVWLFVVIVVVLIILVTFVGLLCQFLVIGWRLCGVLSCGWLICCIWCCCSSGLFTWLLSSAL